MLSSSGTMSNNTTYSNDRNLEAECGVDVSSSGGIFHSDFKKHDDLKEMLDSNKDSLKLEAMKRIIGMIAKGRDASMLFPAVVKNVVSKNIEVKKLVYVYLERYAEEQQDLALLSISTFQRALKEPNQLIRAGALRVLSSIRVAMIAPIVMLAIRDAAADMSPYVRKTAAHAIPKLYSLDKEQKPELILIIQKLLADRTVLVIGSAVMAFTKVCPEREDLIHMVYRKLCNLLIDVDEWGQVIIVNMLTRYAMTQFADPRNLESEDVTNATFYNSDKSTEKSLGLLDPDHKLLLRSTRPLLQSRNAAVVMAVSQLYYYCAPKGEFSIAAKALVRLLRSHTEVQTVVLHTIASISFQRRGMFESYLKSFFVRTSDPTRIKLLKLDILTNLATDANVSTILRELQTYISSSDKQFVAATIQAIGRCACSISEVTDSCLNGLVCLLSNKDEAVVAESVVVIKRLLQTRAAEPTEIITHMARLLDGITVAAARAAILWLLGEHCESVPKVAPDVLRKVAKSFPEEHDIVKLQTLNLAVKLFITNPEQTSLLCYYVFNLARYDQNYDIRDRVRLLRQFTQGNAKGKLVSRAAEIFLASKPAPLLQSQFKDREALQLGSLSHFINSRANGYEALPSFPENPPPGDVRNVETQEYEPKNNEHQLNRLLFADKMSSSEESRKSSSSEGSSDSSSSEEDSEGEESSESSSAKAASGKSSKDGSTSSSTSDSSSSSSSGTESEDESDIESEETKKDNVVAENHIKAPEVKESKSNLDLLLDLDISDTVAPVMTPSLGGFLTPITTANQVLATTPSIQIVSPAFYPVKEIELLDRISGRGLGITYKYTRNPHLFSPNMVNINLSFKNTLSEDITDIRIGKKNLSPGMSIYDFASIKKLPCHCTLPGSIGIDFNDTLQPAAFEIISSIGVTNVLIKPHIGELLRPVKMSDSIFEQEQAKLRGMNEHTATITDAVISDMTIQSIYEVANVALCTKSDVILRFAGQTMLSSIVLITLRSQENKVVIFVNCEKYVVGSMLLNELKLAIKGVGQC